MISYETYLSASFNLGSGSAATNFVRSQFDYGVRQRRSVRGYDTFSARLVLDQTEMSNFEHFWSLLNYGNDKFYTDQVINSDTTTSKIVRFTSGYDVSQIGNNKFMVTVPMELIAKGTQSLSISDTGNIATFTVNSPVVTVI